MSMVLKDLKAGLVSKIWGDTENSLELNDILQHTRNEINHFEQIWYIPESLLVESNCCSASA